MANDNYSQYKRMPFDPKMAREIQGSPAMRTEQGGTAFMSNWGGSSGYSQMSKMNAPERVVYKAVQDGITVENDISSMTGLSPTEVSAAVTSLNRKGFINVEQDAIVAPTEK